MLHEDFLVTVIARLDRAIQRRKLDSPVKPENDQDNALCLHVTCSIGKNKL